MLSCGAHAHTQPKSTYTHGDRGGRVFVGGSSLAHRHTLNAACTRSTAEQPNAAKLFTQSAAVGDVGAQLGRTAMFLETRRSSSLAESPENRASDFGQLYFTARRRLFCNCTNLDLLTTLCTLWTLYITTVQYRIYVWSDTHTHMARPLRQINADPITSLRRNCDSRPFF